jgi:hypothetical protein
VNRRLRLLVVVLGLLVIPVMRSRNKRDERATSMWQLFYSTRWITKPKFIGN